MFWFKILLKISLMGAVAAVSFVGGVRWDKAERYDESVERILAIEEQAGKSLTNLSTRWEAEATNAKIYVEEWNLQQRNDSILFEQLLDGQSKIRSQFNELETEIFITTDLGTCQLTANAVRLLRESSAAANNPGLPQPRD